uniref:Uncharacterized protein n=1 Tax=Rangifer tarandus platyrhynchus TaxID=3082113 RepID=A0ACB0E8V7_RANTA|nr:unnamed protein product [Rangifer tarandus platyrhynchus]
MLKQSPEDELRPPADCHVTRPPRSCHPSGRQRRRQQQACKLVNKLAFTSETADSSVVDGGATYSGPDPGPDYLHFIMAPHIGVFFKAIRRLHSAAGWLGGPVAGTGVGEGLSNHIVIQAAREDEKYRSLAIPPFSVQAEGWRFLKQEDVREATLTCVLAAVTHVLTKVDLAGPDGISVYWRERACSSGPPGSHTSPLGAAKDAFLQFAELAGLFLYSCPHPLQPPGFVATSTWLLEGPGEMRIGKEEEAADLNPLMASSSSLMSSSLSSVQPALRTETAHVLLGVWDIPSSRPLPPGTVRHEVRASSGWLRRIFGLHDSRDWPAEALSPDFLEEPSGPADNRQAENLHSKGCSSPPS